ncbi:MAG: tRNA pseudouridine(38-40) synthase TruA [Cytophagales bacterium]|nr:tRNA pseudouridine(38-40) synthase TruA [Cytophagales bacterium]
MRFFIEIAYKGTNYHGWQIQQNANTVQQEINNALSKVLQCEIKTTGSSRTDTGVHALQQFAHFDITNGIKNVSNILYKLNCILPEDIVIKNIYKVKDDVHARYDAISRSYEYRICKSKDPFLKDTSYFYSRTLNIDKMNKAANLLLSYKDFTTFSKQDTKAKNNSCNIFKADWEVDHSPAPPAVGLFVTSRSSRLHRDRRDLRFAPTGDMLIFCIRANRFLRGMVRAIVGTLLEVGLERMTVKEFENVIAGNDRSRAGFSVPAEGLFLIKVEYPDFLGQIILNIEK